MNGFAAIEAASETIRLMVTDHVNQVATSVTVALKAPDELSGATKAVSIWLYRIGRDPDLVNRPPQRLADGQVERQPLPLDLHYLITPLASQPAMAHDLLGRAMQTLNDHPVVRGGDL